MSKLPYDPMETGVQSRFYEQARSQQEAFLILNRAVLRYHATGRLLDAAELERILPHERHLVLNVPEQWLLQASKKMRRKGREKKWLRWRWLSFLISGLLLFTAGVGPVEPEPAEREAAAPPRQPTAPSELPAPAPEKAGPDGATSTLSPLRARHAQTARIALGNGYFKISRNGKKWGLVNPAGDEILPLLYDRISRFQPGRNLFLIEREGRAGIADATGEVLLHPFFEKVSSYFPLTRQLVVTNGGRQGVYDLAAGRFALGFQFDEVCCFSDGLFGVRFDSGRWGFVDRTGRAIIPGNYDAIVEPFRHGRARVRRQQEEFYIDLAGGEMAIATGPAGKGAERMVQ